LQAKAETLEQLGRGAAALEVYQDLLRLNPADHAGGRYPALALLLRLNRNADATALIERYGEDDSPDWAFTRALIAFRAGGNTSPARQALEHAARQHPHVVAFLTGATALLADPDEAGSQAEADAAAYALRAYPIWWSTPGAIEWLRKS
jgi:tetratricopeptide (TPR) repeat protein